MNYDEKILDMIAYARHAVMLSVYTEIPTALLDACIAAAERGVAMELYINHQHQAAIEGQPFVWHKCVQLVKKGAAMFLTGPGKEHLQYVCMADFAEACEVYTQRLVTWHEAKRVADLQALTRTFETWRTESTPYLQEPGDIRMTLDVSEDIVMKGDTVTVTWGVDLADTVILQGVGDVAAYGTRALPLEQSTIVRLGAYNAQQAQLMARKVWVTEQIKITYDIGFLSPYTQTYTSLVQAEPYPHVYGVAQGHAIRFAWQVADASEVTVSPFHFTKSRGEHVFTPEQSMHLVIHASTQGKMVTRKIMIMVFPVPVFKDKLASLPASAFEPGKALRPPGEMSGLPDRLHTLLKREEQRYQRLNAILYQQYFEVVSKRINLSRIRNFVFARLKSKYAAKGNIIKVLESIQAYYNTTHRTPPPSAPTAGKEGL